MTREEAIERLNRCREILEITSHMDSQNRKAFDIVFQVLKQKPYEDVMAIHTQGLDEGIRCAMCTNAMKSDRGCDGGCVVDDAMYKKVMEVISKQMFELYTSDETVTPQPKVGRWIDDGLYAEGHSHKAFHCSKCEHNVLGFKEDLSNYCPNCGAKMAESGE